MSDTTIQDRAAGAIMGAAGFVLLAVAFLFGSGRHGSAGGFGGPFIGGDR